MASQNDLYVPLILLHLIFYVKNHVYKDKPAHFNQLRENMLNRKILDRLVHLSEYL